MAARALRYTGPAFGGFGLGMSMYFASMGAQRMQAPVIAGCLRLLIATAGGALLAQGWGPWSGMGPEGHFLGVALGISTYGLVCAWGVRASVWKARPAASH